MTQLEEKTSRLVSTLIEKTRQNKVVWRRTISDDFYRALFEDDYILIRRRPNHRDNDSFRYSLSIRNEDGQSVEIMRQSPGEKDHIRLKQVFDAAKESAERYIEDSVEKLLQDLESR